MTALGSLVARLDALAWRLDRGDCPPRDEMERLADEAAALSPSLDDDDRRRLCVAVERVSAALARGRDHLLDRMRILAVGRRAARAYAPESGESLGRS